MSCQFYNAMRFGIAYKDPGADQYEQQYRERIVKQLHRPAAEFGFVLSEREAPLQAASGGVS